jgi:hypothetical protein
MDSGELGFLWITDIINTGYPEDERHRMASRAVRLLGGHFYSKVAERFTDVQSAWMPPPWLRVAGKKSYATESPQDT